MSILNEYIIKTMIKIHREECKEWIPLKEIYNKVEEARGVPNVNKGSSIRRTIEYYCSKCKYFKENKKKEELYILKEKGTGLYKYIYYDNIIKIENLKIGQIFTRDQIMSLFKVSGQSGIMKTNSLDALVLVSDETNCIYEDSKINDGKLIYTGEGKKGDQKLIKNNRTLYDSEKDQLNIYLFTKDKNKIYTFEGQVKLYDKPYETFENDVDGKKRIVWKFPLQVVYCDEKRLEDKKKLQIEKYSKLVNEVKKIEDDIKINSGKQELVFVNEPLKLRRYRKSSERRKVIRKRKPDFIADEIIKTNQGIVNENDVFENEIQKMEKLKAYDKIKIMREFFDNKKENEGFDVLSFELNEDGEYIEKYIEVKSTKGEESTPIDITDNELDFAEVHIDQYYLYRIIKCDSEDRYVKVVKGKELFKNYSFIPTTYKIYLK